MRRLVLTVGFTAILCASSAGCEVESQDVPKDEETKSSEKPILGGTADTAHDAVVYLIGGNSACTGTIIAKNGSTGYVLTAAHCAGMDYVVMDDDLSCLPNNCDGAWEINLQTTHPDYNPNDVSDGYDFSMIRFSGANASTPVIPAATPADGVAVGTMTDMIGYGVTEFGNTDLRMHVVTPVDQLNSLFLAYDQTATAQHPNGVGTCSGDSGGPALFNNKVVGVTSYGDKGCQQLGVSGRVQAVYNDYIAPFIGGQVTETCDSCFDAEVNQPTGDCAPEVEACFTPEGGECDLLVQCFNGCSTQSCYDGCADDHPGGIGEFNAIVSCYCTSCADVCADECESGTTASVSVSSSVNGMMGTGGAAGVGGDGTGATSNEGGSSNGNGGGDNAEDGDEGASGPCDCATTGSRSGAPGSGALGLAGLALAIGALRRRRR